MPRQSRKDVSTLPKRAARLNPGLAINPHAATFGRQNAILTGTSHRYFVPDFPGPLSLKATLQGISTWKVDERECRVSESTYLVVNSGQPYTISYDEPDIVTTFVLLFRDDYLEELVAGMRSSQRATLDDPFRTEPIEVPIRLYAGESVVLRKLRRFASELGQRAVARELWDMKFHELGLALVNEMSDSAPSPSSISAAKASTRDELLRRVSIGRDFLISMSDQDITVEDAARAACVSTFHFHRSFVELFGVSPYHFLRDFRMLRAARLLKINDQPIATILSRVGFHSASSFSGAFRKRFGVGPHAFRNGASGE